MENLQHFCVVLLCIQRMCCSIHCNESFKDLWAKKVISFVKCPSSG